MRRQPYVFQEPSSERPIKWRSLEEKDRSPEENRALAEPEFSHGVVSTDALLGRRQLLSLAGAGAAAVGLEACIRRPEENILPYSKAPEYLIPGVPLHFATVTERQGDAIGLLVRSHEGRPTKIEGNPDHPANRGAIDLWGQAAVMDLYDPDRSRGPKQRGGKDGAPKAAKMEEFEAAFTKLLASHERDGGKRLRILSQPINSPTVLRLREAVLRRLPNARFHTYASINQSQAGEAAKMAFGRPVRTLVEYQKAKVILSIDSDFLMTEPGALRATRAFSLARKPFSPLDSMNRLYVVESAMTLTGANADHRLALPSKNVAGYLRTLARELALHHNVSLGRALGGVFKGSEENIPSEWIKVVADDLAKNRGASAIVVGTRQPAPVHALAHALNHALGNAGATVQYLPVLDPNESGGVRELQTLAQDVRSGAVDTLVILGGNPMYDAPEDVRFGELLQKVTSSVHLSSHFDETSQFCEWHVPRAHELESWGDQQSFDGTRSLQQPLIHPLYEGRSDIEILAMIAGEKKTGYESVRATSLQALSGTASFEADWKAILQTGRFPSVTSEPIAGLEVNDQAIGDAVDTLTANGDAGIELVFAADSKMFDGRFGNNLWLLELPDPITKVVWDNAAQLSARTAKELGVQNGDVISIARAGQEVEIPVWIVPGHADKSITLTLGWGRTQAGKYGSKIGFDVQPLRTSDAFWIATDAKCTKAGRKHDLVVTQEHGSMEERAIAVEGTMHELPDAADSPYHGMPAYKKDPNFANAESPDPSVQPLWKQVDYSGKHKWGMTIDLSSCTGCNACVLACQSENNSPVVGKKEVARGREMYWMRIDRYFVGEDEGEPLVSMQPMACQHCEEAPCENVCPVNATTHSPEGLNEMAYNRCIGTRYCANNCPYKVRRFNYFDWHKRDPHGVIPETKKMQFNPNVTVRMRGVMEKCTYCVQRVQEKKIVARREGRELHDGDVVTACQQTCPASAIAFGDLNDPSSEVSRVRSANRRYALLAEIGTQPRTSYLARIRNPNPNMLVGAGKGTSS